MVSLDKPARPVRPARTVADFPPAFATVDLGGPRFNWCALDASRAEYGARFGCRPGGGVTLLELDSGTVVIVGHMSCAGRADAERHAAAMFDDEGSPNREADWRVTAAQWRDWTATAPQGTPTAARDVKAGDALDLYGDRYGDPDRDPAHGLEFEFAQVESVEFEGPGCVVIATDARNFACPPDHVLYVKREG